MSFVLPESPGDEELSAFMEKQGDVERSLQEESRREETSSVSGDFVTPKKKEGQEEEEKEVKISESMRSLLSTLEGKRQHEYEGTPVVPPPVKPELTVELGHTLDKKLESTIGNGLYHDLTASVLAAPVDTTSALPQLQPFGFSPDKQRLRILSMTDALKYQGELSPRTKLHHFQMFPYSSEAHEAAFVIQRFWEKHIRKRLRAATLVQAHYRKMRCRSKFVEYIERVRRARRAIAGGARRWVEKARLTRDSLLALC